MMHIPYWPSIQPVIARSLYKKSMKLVVYFLRVVTDADIAGTFKVAMTVGSFCRAVSLDPIASARSHILIQLNNIKKLLRDPLLSKGIDTLLYHYRKGVAADRVCTLASVLG